MATFKFLPIPAEDYDALGIGPDTTLQTYVNERGDLTVHVVTDEDAADFVCDGNCGACPLADTDCDGDCFGCPCYANCDDSDYERPEGACKSHGDRRNGQPDKN